MKSKIVFRLLMVGILSLLLPKNCAQNTKLDDFLSLTSTATWKEFGLTSDIQNTAKEKWVWISSITFKSKEALKLKTLRIQWQGGLLDNLSAALFVKKRRDVCVIPIEKNLVCDGQWDKKRQQIVFSLNEKIVATNDYHLVLSFPRPLEEILKKGQFVLSAKNLAHFLLQKNK